MQKKSRLAWNIFGILQLALDLKRRDSAVFLFILSFFIELHCLVVITNLYCLYCMIKKLYCILFDFV